MRRYDRVVSNSYDVASSLLRDPDGNVIVAGATDSPRGVDFGGGDVFGGGFDNPVEVAFTPEGEPLATVNLLHSKPQRVDAILLDSGNPSLKVKELGGTGRRHDWAISRAIRDAVRTPVYLAGGLNAANIKLAVRSVRPYGVDVSSGVEDAPGLKNAEKVSRFLANALKAMEK